MSGGSLGGAYQTDRDSQYFADGGALTKRTLERKLGFAGSISAGYSFDAYRLELEGVYLYNSNEKDKTTGLFGTGGGSFVVESYEENPNVTGSYKQFGLMLNVLKDLAITDQFGLFVGGGLGVARIKGTLTTEVNTAPQSLTISDTTAAGQLLGGGVYHFNDRMDLTLGYRFFITQKGEVTEGTILKIFQEQKLPINHSLALGMKYKF